MAALSIESVDAGYGDFQALFGVTLDVEEGQTVAIIGANGAGKSTLLRAVMGQVRIGRGTIRYRGDEIVMAVNGREVSRGPRPDARKKGYVGLLAQECRAAYRRVEVVLR